MNLGRYKGHQCIRMNEEHRVLQLRRCLPFIELLNVIEHHQASLIDIGIDISIDISIDLSIDN
jgi:hypothetical protein